MNSEKRLLNRKQLAEAIGVHPRTILNYRKTGLPCIRISPKVTKYDLEEVVQWLKDHQMQVSA